MLEQAPQDPRASAVPRVGDWAVPHSLSRFFLDCFPSSSYSESRSLEMLQNVDVESLEFGC